MGCAEEYRSILCTTKTNGDADRVPLKSETDFSTIRHSFHRDYHKLLRTVSLDTEDGQ